LDPESESRQLLAENFDLVAVFDCELGRGDDDQFSLERFLEFHVRDSLAEAIGFSFGAGYNQEQISQLLQDVEDRSCIFCFLGAGLLSSASLQHLREFTQSRHRVLFCGTNDHIDSKCRNDGRYQDLEAAKTLDNDDSAADSVNLDSWFDRPLRMESDESDAESSINLGADSSLNLLSTSDSGRLVGPKPPPGKLPEAYRKTATDNSVDAASEMLKRFFNGR
ncbi:MAG: hypothetical protein MI861_15790, partial [Pirellulales bacterium]|nr:hypothetical protein [Pirellulales bacterium]